MDMSGKTTVCSSCLGLALFLAGCGPSRPIKSVAANPQTTAPPLAPAQSPQPAAPVTPSPSAAEQQGVSQLIEKVEAAYAAGEADYRRGDLPAAKIQFDRAVDMMMMSGIDINA